MMPTRRRLGFSLLEALVVIVALVIIGGLLTLLLRLTLDTERAQASSFDRLVQTSHLADEFRADVGKAEKTLASWQDFQADEHTLILSLPDQLQIVYQWKDGALWRSAYDPDDLNERVVPIQDKGIRFEFVHPVGQGKLVRLRMHRMREGQVSVGQTLEIAAALGGNQR